MPAAYMLLLDVAINRRHLIHIQFAGQDNDIGELGVELKCLRVGDIELGGQMYFLTDLVGILHDRDVGSDNGIHAHGMSFINDLTHERQVFRVHDRINRQVSFHASFPTSCHDSSHIIGSKVDRTAGTHVQVLDTEIDARGTRLYSSRQTLPASYGSHDLYL